MVATRFKATIAIVVLLSLPFAVNAQVVTDSRAQVEATASCQESYVRGEIEANIRHSSAGWFAGGIGSGVLLGLIGTGIVTAVAYGSNPRPSYVPQEYDSACYISGYSSKAKSKNSWNAFGGGLIGTAIIVAIVLSASAN